MQLQTRVAILETREKQYQRKLETAMSILNHAQQSQLEVQKQYDLLEKRWDELTVMYHELQQANRMQADQLKQSIKEQEARRLMEENERYQTELVETRAAMLSYKNMTETITD